METLYTLPYKDKEKQNQWQREWRKKHIERMRKYWRDRNAKVVPGRRKKQLDARKKKLRIELVKHFGNECVLCGEQDYRSVVGVSFHEIYGNAHPYKNETKLRYILEHREDFAPLCIKCHLAVHRFSKTLGLKWGDFLELKEKALKRSNPFA